MARVTIKKCDRCGHEVADTPDDARHRLVRYNSDYHGTGVDLCQDCWKQFWGWLYSTTDTPPGYKRRIRPCPHNIPCADPDGCSGFELVPA